MIDAPLAYVEANWLVAIFVPHDRLHVSASRLLALAKKGDIRIRIPRIAMMEASERIARKVQEEIAKPITDIRKHLGVAGDSVPTLRGDGLIAQAVDEYVQTFSGVDWAQKVESVIDAFGP